jgi:hypothetical protein
VRQQIVVAAVRFLGVAHTGVLAHGPKTATVHGGLDAAGVGIFAGRLAFEAFRVEIGRGVDGFQIVRQCVSSEVRVYQREDAELNSTR